MIYLYDRSAISPHEKLRYEFADANWFTAYAFAQEIGAAIYWEADDIVARRRQSLKMALKNLVEEKLGERPCGILQMVVRCKSGQGRREHHAK